jgi:glucoamylase
MANQAQAPAGAPGTDANWEVGRKDAVGTALSSESNVWFTIASGILTEAFYPQIDTPCLHSVDLIVTDGSVYFSDEENKTDSKVVWHAPGVPAYSITNTANDGRYVISKKVFTNPDHACILQQVSFAAQSSTDHHLYVVLTPRLDGHGSNNSARTIRHGNQTILSAETDKSALALVCSAPLTKATAGFVGAGDGLSDLINHKQLTETYKEALNGNVRLCAEIDLKACDGKFTLALGFGPTREEAIITALDSQGKTIADIESKYIDGWTNWLNELSANDLPDLSKISLATLKCHESKNPAGGIVAGLNTPWGFAQGDNDRNGYHVVWTRDMVETAGGMLAAGSSNQILPTIEFLAKTQQTDGHWPQNMWISGKPYWEGVQMDETALPILLINLARHQQILSDAQLAKFWPMVEKAAAFLVQNGPVTQQDRWEEDPGYTPFTLAAEIAALLAAADLADLQPENQSEAARFMRETADIWYDCIDLWLYARNTDWCQRFSVDGYYQRIMPVANEKISRYQRIVHVQNVMPEETNMPAINLISPDALALVRFGLRRPDDKRITDTVKVIDNLIKIQTPRGESWHRYNDDGYGEQADGSPFNGVGIGRGWPLLSGERAHYELAGKNLDYANRLKTAMEGFMSETGLLSEQIWDSEDIAERQLYSGQATGSARPLAWSHAEYLKLLRSLADNAVFDQPSQTVERYLNNDFTQQRRAWRFNNKLRRMASGKILRVETLSACKVHWSADAWKTSNDITAKDSGLGIYYVDLPSETIAKGQQIEFTFFWSQARKWENQNYIVNVI